MTCVALATRIFLFLRDELTVSQHSGDGTRRVAIAAARMLPVPRLHVRVRKEVAL